MGVLIAPDRPICSLSKVSEDFESSGVVSQQMPELLLQSGGGQDSHRSSGLALLDSTV